MTGASAIYAGTVAHQRLRPRRHRLQYRVYSLLVDLDELPVLGKRLRFFSVNRFNLFGLHERDHGAGDGRSLREYVDEQLAHAGLATGGKVQLLTMPRILGHAFNPLTVYFCRDAQGRLQALIYEVNNTFGERHSYLIEVDPRAPDAPVIAQQCAKQFHVSPFLALDMRYAFRIQPPAAGHERLGLGVTAHDEQGAVLVARFDARRVALSDGALLRLFFTHPLLTMKVVAAIHWEALRLWAKGIPLQPRPAAPGHSVTVIKHQNP
jgi:uncharacterized protein